VIGVVLSDVAFHLLYVISSSSLLRFLKVRIYWSFRRLNKRCIYECTIAEEENRPVFVVKCRERDLDEVSFSGGSPKDAWSGVLDSIARMRLDAGIIKMFPQYITGEDLFGLTEPAVVKILESLPGLEGVADYRFKFGRNPMFEMPLAINPSGKYRQPDLLCTKFKIFREKIFFVTKITSEKFLSISQNLKVTRLQGCTQTKL
jgi:hypothetical protein